MKKKITYWLMVKLIGLARRLANLGWGQYATGIFADADGDARTRVKLNPYPWKKEGQGSLVPVTVITGSASDVGKLLAQTIIASMKTVQPEPWDAEPTNKG